MSRLFNTGAVFEYCTADYINCVSELVNHPAVFLFVFRAHGEFDALVGSVAKFRALRVQRIQPELLTRPEREIPA